VGFALVSASSATPARAWTAFAILLALVVASIAAYVFAGWEQQRL